MKKLVLVADAGRAGLFEAEGLKITNDLAHYEAKDFGIAHRRDGQKNSFAHHNASNNQATAAGSHFYDPHTPPKEDERNDFAHELAQILYKHALQEKYHAVVLAAEPKLLGVLRGKLHPKVASKVEREIAKDLTHKNKTEIQDIIFA